MAALEDALDFREALGRPRIEQRVRSLAAHLRTLAAAIPHVRLNTSHDPRLPAGRTSLALDNVPSQKLRGYLRVRYDIYTADRRRGDRYPADPHGVEGIRLSTHFYNSFEQVGRPKRRPTSDKEDRWQPRRRRRY